MKSYVLIKFLFIYTFIYLKSYGTYLYNCERSENKHIFSREYILTVKSFLEYVPPVLMLETMCCALAENLRARCHSRNKETSFYCTSLTSRLVFLLGARFALS